MPFKCNGKNNGHSQRRRFCPSCKEKGRQPTKHHVLPRRYFRNNNNSPRLWLCRHCHDALEKLIPHEQMERKFYFRVVLEFLGLEKSRPRNVSYEQCLMGLLPGINGLARGYVEPSHLSLTNPEIWIIFVEAEIVSVSAE